MAVVCVCVCAEFTAGKKVYHISLGNYDARNNAIEVDIRCVPFLIYPVNTLSALSISIVFVC